MKLKGSGVKMFVRQIGKEFYVCRKSRRKYGRKSQGFHYSPVFMIKWDNLSGVITNRQSINFPVEFIGKKVMLRVEIVDGN